MIKYAVLFLLCVFLAAACTRNQRGGAPQPAPAASQPAQPASARAITLSSQRPTPTAAASTAPVVRESRPVQQRDQILGLRGGNVYSPEDFEIGVLQGYSEDRDVQIVLSRIRSFQAGLSAKEMPLSDIHPIWREQAQRSLGFHLERGHIPLDVRIGLVDIYMTSRARANIRLIGEPGVAFGEIYLDRSEDTWLISDLQVDMADLADVHEKREGLFEPSVYRMLNLP